MHLPSVWPISIRYGSSTQRYEQSRLISFTLQVIGESRAHLLADAAFFGTTQRRPALHQWISIQEVQA
jgi:hypothetical protein